jgi:ankyrin repeat protein
VPIADRRRSLFGTARVLENGALGVSTAIIVPDGIRTAVSRHPWLPSGVILRDRVSVARRAVVLSKYVLRGFSAMNGNPPRPDEMRSFLRRHALLGELRPAERAMLLTAGEPSSAQITESTWRSEALVALRWAIGDRESLDVGGQVSLMQAVPDVDTDEEVRSLLATTTLRPAGELRRALELWFAVYWRLRLARHGAHEVDLRRWVTASPYLTVLTAADLPLIDNDLSLDGPVMSVAADELEIERDGAWADRIPIRACTPGMLTAGENVLNVAAERLRALRWLFGVTPHLDGDPIGLYRADSTSAGDKEMLYGPAGPPGPADGYDAYGGLPLHRAAWRGDLPTLRALLDDGADLTAADIDGDYTIHCAVLGGHHAAIEAVVAAEPYMYHIPDGEGRLPLHLAAGRGDVGAIEALTGRPDDDRALEVTDREGDTALHTAIRRGHAAAVDRLMEFGASTRGALDAAIESDEPDMVRHLAGRGIAVDTIDDDGTTPLYRALFSANLASAQALLELGVDAGFADESGATALHLAADIGATEMCLRLLDRGAELDRRLQDMAAVHLAFLGGHAECALALIERGADVGGYSEPLLTLALRGGSTPLIAWCLERGEPVSDAPRALLGCAREGWADAIVALMAAGADPGEVNDDGVAALHIAADRGHRASVEALLRGGAAVDPATTDRRFTPLHLAAMHGHDDCVEALLAGGASRSVRDADGHDALEWAIDGGHDACVALLT